MSSDILASWFANAEAWNAALENEELASRKLVTNQAIVDTIVSLQPGLVLDAGCGEGWLSRKLKSLGIVVEGFDGAEKLIDLAKQKDAGGKYQCLSFEDFVNKPIAFEKSFDLAVLNFCLYENELGEQVISTLRSMVKRSGHLVIQTLHPCYFLGSDKPYQSGWMEENWAGLAREFTHPYKWYFRTLQDWIQTINNNGWRLVSIKEPIHPHTNIPASIILIARQ